MIAQDLRRAFRAMTARPGFASAAILSLALGMGANTAIFSLWNSVLHAPLPLVDHPEDLVMLSNPSASGLWRGTWNTITDGPRSWISYPEFEQLRDRSNSFSAVMAAQSSLITWELRVNGGPPEEAQGRLVSGGFFQLLGVRPAIGRLFTNAEDSGEPLYAVISDAFWQRRFGGRADVLGTSLRIRDSLVTIVGVTPEGFVGENSGQRPDVWLPLRLQPRVAAGGDWLHETAPPEKVMWLHVFGRLKPGVSAAQAEQESNNIFRAGLESYYGSIDSDRRRGLLDQRLQLFPGARGVSSTLEQFSSALTMMLASVSILLLIACANLANLLLARSASRRGEIAVRMSLGASRGQLVQQLVIESLALATAGGVAAIGVSYGLHGVLVRMLQQADSRFFVSFAFNLRVLLFALGGIVVAALAVGVIPALQATRSDIGSQLYQSGRGAIGTVKQSRSSRWLVAFQLALSLPLLVGAGLLVQTLYNLQHPELGFRPERLVLARINLNELAQDVDRRDRALRELRARIAQISGVDAVSFSQLGLFGGGVSTVGIRVEGSPLTSERERESALDRVGAGYFTTLGIPIRSGRDISDGDRANTRLVCVVNEAFVQRYLPGRNPLGLRVTALDDNGGDRVYEIVGVAGNARIQDLRAPSNPRFFVAAEQRFSASTTRTFLIRTTADAPAVTEAVREAVRAFPPVAVSQITAFDDHLADLTAEDRAVARLALAFGTVAMLLAALGLYGVLSYGVVRRSREIAVRIALGAQARAIIAMVLGESLRLVAAGYLMGGLLAYLGTRLIAARLYGVAPQDPAIATLAGGTLLLVAFAAAFVPARRASKVNPIAALREG